VGTIQDHYDLLRDRYDRAAGLWKGWYHIVVLTASVLTWLTLLLVVIALIVQCELFQEIVRHRITPVLSGFAALATVVLLFVDLSARWREYRRSAETLRSECMRYRAKLPPYDKGDAELAFEQLLERTRKRAEARQGERYLDRWHWGFYLGLAWIPDHLAKERPHTPDEPDALTRRASPTEEAQAVLFGRLENQQRWHLLKARSYCRLWALCFQLPILAVSLTSIAFGLWYQDRALEVIAILTSCSLMLFALRDFLDYGPLFRRYLRVVGNLEDVRNDYLHHEGSFTGCNDEERLRRLVQYTERVLCGEYEFWYASAR
jgi:hypothetical protein